MNQGVNQQPIFRFSPDCFPWGNRTRVSKRSKFLFLLLVPFLFEIFLSYQNPQYSLDILVGIWYNYGMCYLRQDKINKQNHLVDNDGRFTM